MIHRSFQRRSPGRSRVSYAEFAKAFSAYIRSDHGTRMKIELGVAFSWQIFVMVYNGPEDFAALPLDQKSRYLRNFGRLEIETRANKGDELIAQGIKLVRLYLVFIREGEILAANMAANQLELLNKRGWPLLREELAMEMFPDSDAWIARGMLAGSYRGFTHLYDATAPSRVRLADDVEELSM